MQTSTSPDLPKRSRYYQGMIDFELIEKGCRYRELNRSFIIFICTFDPFDDGRCIYTFENRCRQDPALVLNDETQKIFLNSKGDMSEVPEDLRAFLEYLNGKASEHPFIIRLDDEVHKARRNENWRRH